MIINVLLFFVAIILTAVIAPLAVVAKVLFAFKARKFDDSWFRRMAYSVDQFGNVIADDLFSSLLIHDDNIAPFGDPDETISSVLGKNARAKNLTSYGRVLKRILHWFDPNHVEKSIEK